MPGILTALKGVISGKGPELVKAVGDGLDNLFTSKEEKAILENKKSEIEALLQEKIMAHEERVEEIAIEKLKVEIDREKAYLADTQDARMNNTKIQESDKASWLSKNVGYILDLFLGAIWGTVTVFIVAKAFKIIDSNADMTAVLSIYGTITAVFMISLQFHRGTSKGSEDKSKELKEIRRNK